MVPVQAATESGALELTDVEIDVGFPEPCRQGGGNRPASEKAASSRHHPDRTTGRRATWHVSQHLDEGLPHVALQFGLRHARLLKIELVEHAILVARHDRRGCDRSARSERDAQTDHRAKAIGSQQGGMPCHGRAPVVPRDHSLFGAQHVEESHHIADEMQQGVLVDRLRSVGPAVTAHVGRDGVESGCRQRRELVAPRIPALRKAVAQDHERPFPLLGKVEMDAVRLDNAMRDTAAALCVDLVALEDGTTHRRSEPRYEFAPSHPRSPC